MFSGIVEMIGTIINIEMLDGCKYFTIKPEQVCTDLIIGESISVNGACMSVVSFTDSTFSFAAVPETLRLTNLESLQVNAAVNLERSIKANSRIGGHNVQGHVDTKGTILELSHDASAALLVKISIPTRLAKYVVAKGYITLDGMSITVVEATDEWFTVTFIPHTQQVTITKFYKVGSEINIEVDILGKYIEKLLGAYTHASTN